MCHSVLFVRTPTGGKTQYRRREFGTVVARNSFALDDRRTDVSETRSNGFES